MGRWEVKGVTKEGSSDRGGAYSEKKSVEITLTDGGGTPLSGESGSGGLS